MLKFQSVIKHAHSDVSSESINNYLLDSAVKSAQFTVRPVDVYRCMVIDPIRHLLSSNYNKETAERMYYTLRQSFIEIFQEDIKIEGIDNNNVISTSIHKLPEIIENYLMGIDYNHNMNCAAINSAKIIVDNDEYVAIIGGDAMEFTDANKMAKSLHDLHVSYVCVEGDYEEFPKSLNVLNTYGISVYEDEQMMNNVMLTESGRNRTLKRNYILNRLLNSTSDFQSYHNDKY